MKGTSTVLALSDASSDSNGVYSAMWHDAPQLSACKLMKWSEYVGISVIAVDNYSEPRSRCKHAACLNGSTVYIFGGKDGNIALSDMWAFEIKTGKWNFISVFGTKLPCLQDHSMIVYENSLYIFGGSFSDTFEPDIPLWKFDIDSAECRKLSASKVSCLNSKVQNTNQIYPSGRRGHTAVVYGNFMFVFGGYVDMKGSNSELWQYHFADDVWMLASSGSSGSVCGPSARHSHTTVVYRHRLWIYGGLCNLEALDDMWTWHLDTQKWSRVLCRTRSPALEGHTACVVGTSMYVLGGCENGSPQNAVWIFDLDFLTWTRVSTDSIPCGPITKHRCVLTVTAQPELSNRRNFSMTSMRSSQTGDSSVFMTSPVVRMEPRRSTYPPAKSGYSASHEVPSASSTGEETVSSTSQTKENVDASSDNCYSLCVSTFKRKHKINSDQQMFFDDLQFSSREDLLQYSRQETCSSACFESNGDLERGHCAQNVCPSSGIDNRVFNLMDENRLWPTADDVDCSSHKLAVEMLGVAVDCYPSYPNRPLNRTFGTSPNTVELKQYSSGLGVERESGNQLRVEDLERQTIDYCGADMIASAESTRHGEERRSWHQSVREAWTSFPEVNDHDSSSSIDEPLNELYSHCGAPTTNLYTIYVFGGQATRACTNIEKRPMPVYRLQITPESR